MPATAASPAAPVPSSLPTPALARRLADLCGDERNLLVDFLLHLSEFDSRDAWAAAGYGSLWAWCTEVLHLREGATARRIGAMKLLRRFPSLEAPLRDGRLCLTTLNELGPLLDESNVDGLVAQAAFLSKADTKRLVVAIKPVDAPKDGLRKLPVRVASANVASAASGPSSPVAEAEGLAAPGLAVPAAPGLVAPGLATPTAAGAADSAPGSSFPLPSPAALPAPLPTQLPAPRPLRAEVQPVSATTYSLHVTLDEAAKAELDELVALLSHKTRGNLAATLREAVRCGIAKHGKRKGAVAPERKRAARASKPAGVAPKQAAPRDPAAPVNGSAEPGLAPDASDPRYIPIEVKRVVWDRDGGRCAWVSPEGERCGSRHKLEFGHIRPVALGGKSTVENIRLECRCHNRFEADRVFGREHMETFRGRGTAASGSDEQ